MGGRRRAPGARCERTVSAGCRQPERLAREGLELDGLDATHRVGLALAQTLPARAIVLCAGELGAGKTTLIKAVCEGLGIAPRVVISPTYTLVNVYPGPRSVYHVDLYRLETPEALLELDPEDWVNPDGMTLIEWPEAARPLLAGQAVLELELSTVPGRPGARRLKARAADAAYAGALAALAALLPVHPGQLPPRA
jgi:tRNA threonylcarbamoyladenosine biosynthesis protein TsaE